MGGKNNLREKFSSKFSVAGCNKKRGWIRMRIFIFLVGEDWKIMKVYAECEYLGECSSCVLAVEKRKGK